MEPFSTAVAASCSDLCIRQNIANNSRTELWVLNPILRDSDQQP